MAIKFPNRVLLFFVCVSLLTGESHAAADCDDASLKALFAPGLAKGERRPWEVVEDALTSDLKACLLARTLRHNQTDRVDANHVRFRGDTYRMITPGVIDAPASDLGYAAVFERPGAVLKFGFSPYPNGGANLLNAFLIRWDGTAATFYEAKDGGLQRQDDKCLECHRFSKRPDRRLGRYGR